MTMSDRIAVMNHGRYEQLGDPASLYERPRTRFVAGFLGVSNLLPTTPDGTATASSPSRASPTGRRCASRVALTEGLAAYEIGVRPEKIRLLELHDPVPDGVNQLLGTVRDVSYLGVSTSYIVETRGGGSMTVYEQNVQRATRAELWEPGEEVRAVWSPTHTFAVEAGGEPPPDLPLTGAIAAAARGTASAAERASRDGASSSVARSRVAAVGFGAFLASTAGGGTKPTPSSSTAAVRLVRAAGPVRRSLGLRRGVSIGGGQRAHPQPDPGDRHPPVRQLGRLHGHRRGDQQVPDPGTVHQGDRDQGRLRRGHRRQRDVLHVEPGRTAWRGPPHGMGPHRHDRLDDRQAGQAGLAGNARSDAQLPGQPPGDLPRALVRPEHEPGRPVPVRDDRHDDRPEEDRSAGLAQRPVQRQVRREDDLPRRDARHDRADRPRTSGSIPPASPRSSSTPRWRWSTRPSRTAGSARSWATSTRSS